MEHESTTYLKNLETVTRSSARHSELSELRVPGLTILAHPDPRRIGERVALTALASGRDVPISRLEPEFAASVPLGKAEEGSAARRRPLADPHLSRRPLRLAPAVKGAVRLITTDTKTRAVANGVPVVESQDFALAEIERGVVLLLADRIVLLLHTLDPLPPQEVSVFGLVGESAGIVAIRRDIARVADLDVPALLRGETGTGKELVAGAIHQASARRGGPFVAVNMGAVPSTLAAAELFGATKGAFTGADRRRTGYFGRAQEGTLFLDEIGETPSEVQVMLLRTLETSVIQPVGSETSQKVDVRILAATDAHLEFEIEAGRFRAPLLHRLSGYEIRIPPLRQRRDDIGRLLFHFLRQELDAIGEPWRLDDRSASTDPWLSAPLVARLASYVWPGNVRQLRNVVRQLVIGNRGAAQLRITPQIEELLGETGYVPAVAPPPAAPADVHDPPTGEIDERAVVGGTALDDTAEVPQVSPPEAASQPAPAEKPRPSYRSPHDVSEDELLAALEAHDYRFQPTAAALGISRTSLYALVEKSPRIGKARDLTGEEIERARERCGGDPAAMAAELKVSRKGLSRRMTQLGLG